MSFKTLTVIEALSKDGVLMEPVATLLRAAFKTDVTQVVLAEREKMKEVA
jgi:hypothetical protein